MGVTRVLVTASAEVVFEAAMLIRLEARSRTENPNRVVKYAPQSAMRLKNGYM